MKLFKKVNKIFEDLFAAHDFFAVAVKINRKVCELLENRF